MHFVRLRVFLRLRVELLDVHGLGLCRENVTLFEELLHFLLPQILDRLVPAQNILFLPVTLKLLANGLLRAQHTLQKPVHVEGPGGAGRPVVLAETNGRGEVGIGTGRVVDHPGHQVDVEGLEALLLKVEA